MKEMKKIFKWALCAACVMGMAACQGKGTDVQSDKEAALQRAAAPYVNNTVVATYRSMADAGLTLLDQCEAILAAQEAGQDYAALIKDADASWRLMRKYWEQSEAFLYGPAAAHNIDPHIDSWPLDFNAMNALLHDSVQMAAIEEQGGAYVGEKLGYALKGFHACEYLLFESVIIDGRAVGTGKPHAANLTHAEAVYLLGIVEDLTQQAILLEYCWAGEVSDAKMKILEEGEVDTFEDKYGWQMINAGKPGSTYLTERDYIESPYSCTSTTDFADNIRSIQHSYCGSQAGDYSVSSYVFTQDAALDAKVRKAIEDAIAAIEAIEDFENTAKGNPQVKEAIDRVSELEGILSDEVLPLLSK